MSSITTTASAPWPTGACCDVRIRRNGGCPRKREYPPGETAFPKRSRFAVLRFGLREKECGETMKLLYATGNESKICNMRYRLRGYEIEVVTPKELGIHIDVEETGSTPMENARLKAKAYFEKTGMPTLAADSGLYIDGIPEAEQPGLHVRRVRGRDLSEEELIDRYSQLSAKYGGRLRARYKTGLVLLIGDREYTAEIPDDDIFIVSEPNSNRRHRGNPLDVVTVCPANGRYFNECSLDELAVLAGHFDRECVRFLEESVLRQ